MRGDPLGSVSLDGHRGGLSVLPRGRGMGGTEDHVRGEGGGILQEVMREEII